MASGKRRTNRLAAIFPFLRRKLGPEELLKELKVNLRSVNQALIRQDYDLKNLRLEKERAIQKGTRNVNDAALRREAAAEIRYLGAEMAAAGSSRDKIIKSRMLCRLTIRRLEAAARGGAGEVAQRLMGLFNNPELGELMVSEELSEEQFGRELEIKIATVMGDLETQVAPLEADLSAEEKILIELAKAETEGNEERVAECMQALENPTQRSPEDSDLGF